jgi:hypothetical protein
MKNKKNDKGKAVATPPLIQPPKRPLDNNSNAAETSKVLERTARQQVQSDKLRHNNDASEGDMPSGAASSNCIPIPSPAQSEKLQCSDDAQEDDNVRAMSYAQSIDKARSYNHTTTR